MPTPEEWRENLRKLQSLTQAIGNDPASPRAEEPKEDKAEAEAREVTEQVTESDEMDLLAAMIISVLDIMPDTERKREFLATMLKGVVSQTVALVMSYVQQDN